MVTHTVKSKPASAGTGDTNSPCSSECPPRVRIGGGRAGEDRAVDSPNSFNATRIKCHVYLCHLSKEIKLQQTEALKSPAVKKSVSLCMSWCHLPSLKNHRSFCHFLFLFQGSPVHVQGKCFGSTDFQCKFLNAQRRKERPSKAGSLPKFTRGAQLLALLSPRPSSVPMYKPGLPPNTPLPLCGPPVSSGSCTCPTSNPAHCEYF